MTAQLQTELERLDKEREPISYSVVIPVQNEEGNVEPLFEEVARVMDQLRGPYEIIFVDDGSTDRTFEELTLLHLNHQEVHIVKLARNYGQTAGLAAGFDFAHGAIIITLDGDLQNDPADIPRLLEKMAEGFDIVSGWRKNRAEPFLRRRLPSMIANRIMARLSGVRLNDFGSTIKAYKRDIIKNVRLYGEMHRFIPALASVIGASVAELPVNDRPRERGKSKYGLSRTIRVVLDFLTIKFLLGYLTRPLHFFGPPGLVALAVGILIGVYLVAKKIILGIHILEHHGPLLLLSILLIITGVQVISLGLIGEVVTRTYHESQRRPIYSIKEIKSRRTEAPVRR
jgi:glycosyltransferase involved in cell wall biosynthesis